MQQWHREVERRLSEVAVQDDSTLEQAVPGAKVFCERLSMASAAMGAVCG